MGLIELGGLVLFGGVAVVASYQRLNTHLSKKGKSYYWHADWFNPLLLITVSFILFTLLSYLVNFWFFLGIHFSFWIILIVSPIITVIKAVSFCKMSSRLIIVLFSQTKY